VDVYFNGALLTTGTDYTETNGTTITLLFDLVPTDQVQIIYGQVTDILTVDAQSVGEALYPQTANEIAAGITPTDSRYPEGSLKRYGAVGDNSTDDTANVQTAFNLASISSSGSVGTVYVQPGRYVLTNTISLSTNTAQYLNIISDLPYGSAVFEWAGPANTPMFQISGWNNGIIENIVCRTRDVAGIVAWDIKTDSLHGFANRTLFSNCTVEFGTGGSCIGWRAGYTTGGSGDVSAIRFETCTCYGTNSSYNDIGWQNLRWNGLMWTFVNCQGFFLGKKFTNAKTTGSESGGGSMSFYGGGGSNNALEFEFYTNGVYTISGGRYESGDRFLKTGHSTSVDAINVHMSGLDLGGYDPSDEILFHLEGSTQLTIDTCQISKYFEPDDYTAAMITVPNAVANRHTSIVVRNSSIQAADPFYTVTGSTGIVSVTVDQCLKKIFGSHTPQGRFISKSTFDEYTYTPVWTAASVNPAIGNGTVQGTYKRDGTRITASIYISMGSTTTYGTGAYYFSLPVIPISSRSTDIGQAFIVDDGTGYIAGIAVPLHDGTARCQVHAYNSTQISPTVPMTWAVNDSLKITLTYEAAS
jgi:hypothetical protein